MDIGLRITLREIVAFIVIIGPHLWLRLREHSGQKKKLGYLGKKSLISIKKTVKIILPHQCLFKKKSNFMLSASIILFFICGEVVLC